MDKLTIVVAEWNKMPGNNGPASFGVTHDPQVFPPVLVSLSKEMREAFGSPEHYRVTIEPVQSEEE